MLKSMTGFGIAHAETDKVEINVEIKSLNSKFLDANLRIPKEFYDKDIEIRHLLINTLERGKISFSIDLIEKGEGTSKLSINKNLVKKYYLELVEAASYAGASDTDLFKLALQMPKAMDSNADNGEEPGTNWQEVLNVVKKAIAQCEDYRLDEGKLLEEKFRGYINKIEKLLEIVEMHDPARVQHVREKIRNSFHEFSSEAIDNNRFEQELIYYIEKLDISEEKVRLKRHIDYFNETLSHQESNGKKLSFIAQEIGREINTIGSKANDANIQHSVVEMKEELEKIKEQVLNIL